MENKKEIKKYNPEEAKNEVLSAVNFLNNKDALLKELTQDIIPKCLDPKHEKDEVIKKRFTDQSMRLLRIFENESHVGLMESFEERYRILSYEMSKTMIKEFDCNNEVEKALVELVVNAYIRVIDNSRRLNNDLGSEGTSITENKTKYLNMISIQIDRANRQFLNALTTLKQLKTPQVEMNIKANTAFISNNQQVNVNKDENIKAQ